MSDKTVYIEFSNYFLDKTPKALAMTKRIDHLSLIKIIISSLWKILAGNVKPCDWLGESICKNTCAKRLFSKRETHLQNMGRKQPKTSMYISLKKT